ncbi:M81 family metallopeptidase [Prauserella endophytica]|uniref:M81 family metallopeptidase n=1 Tax=Prauserella endophytica TaxID=1592324 RepID=A0ABY2RZB8_9PSEU|nr:M81 family metallopeptidase [Prauserella endophytica]TKG66624.1 M81 family metallopeptidase [Prauserella endophytica]
MRFATLGLFHEANTFSPTPADRRLFTAGGILRGQEIVAEYDGSSATIGGYLAETGRLGIELVPLVFAFVNPVGAITDDAFESIVGEMLDRLAEQGPWDGVLLNIHGAAVAERHPDADGEIASRVRGVVGPDVPVGAVLDLHANISPRLVDALTVTLVYQTNPHVDAREQAIACTRLVAGCARGEIRPRQSLVQLPLVVNIARQDTNEQPMSGLVAKAAQLGRRPGMLSVSVVEGFPYADVGHMGMTCLAVHDGDQSRADAAARELAAEVWERRSALQARELDVDQALDLAECEPEGPVVLLDVGDNIGGGAPGDSTVVLEAAVKRGLGSLLQTLWDPESVRCCEVAGTGAEVRLRVGACSAHSAGNPVPVVGRVRALADGRFEAKDSVHAGLRFFDMGPTAVVDTEAGHTLVLTSKPVMNSSLYQHYSVGVDPGDYHVVVAKGVNSPRAAYGPIASRMVVADTEGVTAMNLDKLAYRHRRRPMYPFELPDFDPGNP